LNCPAKPSLVMLIVTLRILSMRTNPDNYNATYNPSGSRNSNPVLDSTGGTAGTGGSGTIASGWSGGNGGDTGHTRVYSKVTGANTGRPAQRVVLAGTMGANTEISLLFISMTGQTIGDRVRLAVELDGWTGLSNVESICAVINPNGPTWDGGVADMHYLDAANADRTGNTSPIGNLPATVTAGLMVTPYFVLTHTPPRILLAARAITGKTIAATVDVLNIALIG